ncbi:PAS domain-containing protein [Kordiimonas aquimaris]|uniref:PAS domain-containing protein n=1 Tax=Kordiimonas aquimaris TaxID=707591 RepID=UPI0021D11146|nr:PAS domain S-box protein [Kordiimonas aquimaris]
MNFIGQEVFFDRDDLIVSKTDLDGRLTYVNHTFMEVSNYEEHELIGKQHNVIRHPNMPRAVFEMLWSTIKSGNEIFAYVVNSTKSGDHYWVNAHVTPSFRGGAIVGYHSTRRVPSAATITGKIIPLYDEMLAIEASNSSKKEGLQQSVATFKAKLADLGMSYDEFVADLKKDD